MTLLEALKSTVGYPVPDVTAETLALKRGLVVMNDGNAIVATQALLDSKEFELATADIYNWLVTTPSIKEGGYSISMTEKEQLKALASGIYSKWNVLDPNTPTARFVSMG